MPLHIPSPSGKIFHHLSAGLPKEHWKHPEDIWKKKKSSHCFLKFGGSNKTLQICGILAVNFQTKAEKPLFFLITFLSCSCLVSYVWIAMCCMTLSKLFLDETIGNTVDLQTIIYHFSRSWVSCILSNQISSIS